MKKIINIVTVLIFVIYAVMHFTLKIEIDNFTLTSIVIVLILNTNKNE